MLIVLVVSFAFCASAQPRSCPALRVIDTDNNGAWYHKVVSPRSKEFVGISGVVTLGLPTFDMTRFASPKNFIGNYDKFALVPLDRPSLVCLCWFGFSFLSFCLCQYLGGFSSYECDVGLTWDRMFRPEDGLPIYTDASDGNSNGIREKEFFVEVLQGEPVLLRRSDRQEVARGREAVQGRIAELMPAMAYRPYWRAFDRKAGNVWGTESIRSANNLYFYPKQSITMELRLIGPEWMVLSIFAVHNGSPYEFRKQFEQLTWVPGVSSIIWKRVNSIDQAGNECKGISTPLRTEKGRRWLDSQGKICGVEVRKNILFMRCICNQLLVSLLSRP